VATGTATALRQGGPGSCANIDPALTTGATLKGQHQMAFDTLDAAEATDSQRVKALSDVLSLIAGDSSTVVHLIHDAASGAAGREAQLIAAGALAERIGWMADLAAQHSGNGGCQASGEWLLSLPARDAMRTLGAAI
jgi:hypothetical protein